MQRDARVALLLLLVAPAPARECGQDELLARDITGCVSFAHIRYLNPGGAVWLGDVRKISIEHSTCECACLSRRRCTRVSLTRDHPCAGQALHNNSDLELLDLHHTHLGDEDALALAAGLKNNTVLRRLAMHNNHITCVGSAALGEALAENDALQELSLSSNSVGDKGECPLSASTHARRDGITRARQASARWPHPHMPSPHRPSPPRPRAPQA